MTTFMPWTDEDTKTLSLLATSKRAYEIAKIMSRSPTTVYVKAKQYEIKIKYSRSPAHDEDGNRICMVCGEKGPFGKNSSAPDGLKSKCYSCLSEIEKNSSKLDKNRNARLKRIYSIDLKAYYDLLEKQGGRCAICGTGSPGHQKTFFSIDHDHNCCPGKSSCGDCIRGLLCSPCNVGLYLVDRVGLEVIGDYLEYNS